MLSRFWNGRGIGECRAMICGLDLDGNGVLSFDEFKILMSA
jgi:calcium-binding protein CML